MTPFSNEEIESLRDFAFRLLPWATRIGVSAEVIEQDEDGTFSTALVSRRSRYQTPQQAKLGIDAAVVPHNAMARLIATVDNRNRRIVELEAAVAETIATLARLNAG